MSVSIARRSVAPAVETYFPVDSYRRGCIGELAVCRVLGGLAYQGFRHMDDRRWPGSERANVDHVLVGPTGVYLVDSKHWGGQLEVVGTSLTQNQRRRDDRLANLVRLADAVDRHLTDAGFGLVRCIPTVCFSDAPLTDQASLGRIMLTDLGSLADRVSNRAPVLDDRQVASLWVLLCDVMVEYEIDDSLVDDALFALDEERDTGMSAALERPMSDWMAWLHPEQKPVVTRSFNGPARIRGAAGTGKTTVGLHRLARIAGTRPGSLLWVSYVKSLSPVMRETYRRISPETTERVTFTHLHGLAKTILQERNVSHRIDKVESWRAFHSAWARSGDELSIEKTGLNQKYYEEEIEYVIKGRGLTSLDAYLAVQRIGRQTEPSRVSCRLLVGGGVG